MQAQLLDPNVTRFTKDETKQACHESLKQLEKALFKVEDKDDITLLKKGLEDILKTQDTYVGLLKEESKEKTDSLVMFREHFDQNLNPLMS